MAEREIKRWVTWHGRRIPIYEGESKADVAARIKGEAKEGLKKGKEFQKKQNEKHSQDVQAKKEALDKARKKSNEKGRKWANNPTERRKQAYQKAVDDAQKASKDFSDARDNKVKAKFHKKGESDHDKAVEFFAKKEGISKEKAANMVKNMDPETVKRIMAKGDMKKTEYKSEISKFNVEDYKKKVASDSDFYAKVAGIKSKKMVDKEKAEKKGSKVEDVGHGLRKFQTADGRTLYKDASGHWVKKADAEAKLKNAKAESHDKEPVSKKDEESKGSKAYSQADFDKEFGKDMAKDSGLERPGTKITSIHVPDDDENPYLGVEYSDGKTYVYGAAFDRPVDKDTMKKMVSAPARSEDEAVKEKQITNANKQKDTLNGISSSPNRPNKSLGEKAEDAKENAKLRTELAQEEHFKKQGESSWEPKEGDRVSNVGYNEAKNKLFNAPAGTVIQMSNHNLGDYEGEYTKQADGSWVGSQKYKSNRSTPPTVKTADGFATQVQGNDVKVLTGGQKKANNTEEKSSIEPTRTFGNALWNQSIRDMTKELKGLEEGVELSFRYNGIRKNLTRFGIGFVDDTGKVYSNLTTAGFLVGSWKNGSHHTLAEFYEKNLKMSKKGAK